MLSLLAAEERPDIRVTGLDISPPAVAVANRLLDASGLAGRVSFAVQDALRSGSAGRTVTYQGIISAMLAEHLPTPKPLFDSLAAQIAPQGLVFFSTALESAQRDHVFEIPSGERAAQDGGGSGTAGTADDFRCECRRPASAVPAARDRDAAAGALKIRNGW